MKDRSRGFAPWRRMGATVVLLGGVSALAVASTATPSQSGINCSQQQTFTVASPRVRTGAVQTLTVPQTGTVTVTAVGGAGSDSFNNGVDGQLGTGGNGAQVTATLPVNAGAVLNILVGAQGGADLGNGVGGGGGGGSFVYSGPSTAYSPATDTLLVVAGGGGGASGLQAANGGPGRTTNLTSGPASPAASGQGGFNFNNVGPGAAAGGQNGGGGGGGANNSTGAGGGGGVTGDGATVTGFFGGQGGASLANGAAGGVGPTTGSLTGGNGGFGGGGAGSYGGGGGGGYSGGGGGDQGGGGGGGGSFVAATATGFSASVAGTAADGQVSVCFSPAPVPTMPPLGLLALAIALLFTGFHLTRSGGRKEAG